MGLRTETKRNLAIGIAILIALSLMLVNHATAASNGLNLPSTPVRIEVKNGTETYFNTELSDVPAGYDVANTTYFGWCVDRTANMTRSPANHEVILYSSSNPPGNLASEKWDKVNYILNHKQGTPDDIQQAIWYFINMAGKYTPTSTMAWEIVSGALANGNGFIPANGQRIAIICFPVVLFPGSPDVQVSIIEVENNMSPTAPDVAIANVALTKTIVGQGLPTEINVTVANFGNNDEDFNVTTYADATFIAKQEITLTVGNSTTISFGWSTAGFAYGNYTIKVIADTVPGETNTADNTFVAGSIIVTIPGDLNGDLKVTLSDLVILANAYGSKPGDIKWNPNSDINGNGKVDLADLVTMATHYGQHYP
jgi:hypothetical protein